MGLAIRPLLTRGAACVAPVAVLALSIAHYALTNSAWAEQAKPIRALAREETALPRPRPDAVPAERAESGSAAVAYDAELPKNFRHLAKQPGEPQIPGLTIVYLHPLGLPGDAVKWQNIIVHQTEGPAASPKTMALAQTKNPTKRGVMVWGETDGTLYRSTSHNPTPTNDDGPNPNDT